MNVKSSKNKKVESNKDKSQEIIKSKEIDLNTNDISDENIEEKTLLVVLKNIFIIFLFIFFISKNLMLLEFWIMRQKISLKIILEIKKINNITKNINFIIISNEEINAYVNQDNLIYKLQSY